MKGFLCLFGFHKYDKVLIATVIHNRKTYKIHREICKICGHLKPSKDNDRYERIHYK